MPDCSCNSVPDGEKRIWCERHQCWKTRNWVKLCQTREDYRKAWDEGRGPGQVKTASVGNSIVSRKTDSEPAKYLSCHHRGPVVGTTTGSVAGMGCGGTRVEFYQCQHFNEPVLKGCKTWNRNRDKLRDACPGFNGRTCRECELWKADTPNQSCTMPRLILDQAIQRAESAQS